MLILGVTDRRAAAWILAEYEERDPLAHQAPRIAVHPEPTGASSAPQDEWPPDYGVSTEAAQEEQAVFDASPPGRRPSPPLFSTGGAAPGRAGWRGRLAWIAAITISMAIAIGVLVSALEALTRVIRS